MIWLAVEDAYTNEISDFEEVDEEQVHYLMDGYKVDICSPEQTRVQDTENGQRIVYEGVIYKGGFGYNLWVTRKFLVL